MESLDLTKFLNLSDDNLKAFPANYNPQTDPEYQRQKLIENTIIIILYSIIFVLSLFGNLFVCYILMKHKMRTVMNCYILNLTISDLVMTLVNIPFNTTQLLLDDWPFGDFLCKCVPFIQTCSVYVSTITMCVIGIDRYQTLVHPFTERLSSLISIKIMIPLIWIISSLFSIPHAYFNKVVKKFSYRSLTRCSVELPQPQIIYRRWLTIITFFSQYIIPLSIATICYLKIAHHIHRRVSLGKMTQQQMNNNARANRKTIIMLMIVLAVFAICWLPVNVYHIIMDFSSNPTKINNFLFLAFHWLAMSSVIYNPFIYTIRNSCFRDSMKMIYNHFCCGCKKASLRNSLSASDKCETRSTFRLSGNGHQKGEINKKQKNNALDMSHKITNKQFVRNQDEIRICDSHITEETNV